MKLTQPEIIQLLRRRKDLNQGTLGSRAFNTSFESGRTKIKNIELGRQQPTQADLENLAEVLKVPISTLVPTDGAKSQDTGQTADGATEVCLHARTLAAFPGLAPYLEMLNKAVVVLDEELIDHISEKIAHLFQQRVDVPANAPRRLTSESK